MKPRKKAIKELRLELARRSFYAYCQVVAGDFYAADRVYLKDLCESLQDFYESEDRFLIINAPPRHGKSRTAGLFVEWVLGKNIHEHVMTGSYNEVLSTRFSRAVRDSILEKKGDSEQIVYRDIFPGSQIKKGDASINLWSLEGSHSSYLATSPTGTATGFGATVMIIDDLIKSDLEANNENVLENHWLWFTNTMMSRLEKGGKVIVVMTRWRTDDLAGSILNLCKQEDISHRHINFTAVQPDGSMLCDGVLDKQGLDLLKHTLDAQTLQANYQQEPIDLVGRLYSEFMEYEEAPAFEGIRGYIDFADKGSDYLCSIVYGIYQEEAYIIDVLYTKDPIAATVPLVARQFIRYQVDSAQIESNGGGSAFKYAVKQELLHKHQSTYTNIRDFHQAENKEARILANSHWVENHLYMPSRWKQKHATFYTDLTRFQRTGKNKHDDAPDAITGIAISMKKPNRKTKLVDKSLVPWL